MLKTARRWVRVALASVEGRQPLPECRNGPAMLLGCAGTFNEVGSPQREEGDVAEDIASRESEDS